MKNKMTVRSFLEQNPYATTKAVMRATGSTAKTVYSIRWALRKDGVDCAPPHSKKKVTPIDLSAAGSPLQLSIKPNPRLIGSENAVARPKARLAVAEDFAKPEFGASNVDLVNNPPHYTTGGIETIDFIEAKKLNYNLGNAVKYITRADHKGNRLQDLQKAKWYLEREILSSHI